MGLGSPEKSGDTLCEKAWDAEHLAEKKKQGGLTGDREGLKRQRLKTRKSNREGK